MPRVPREVEDGGIYHVLNRSNDRQRVFHKEEDYQAFLKVLGQTTEQFGLVLFAYCLMPNHFHLLMKVARGEDLSRGMRWFMTTHATRYRQHYQGSGHLWQGRFKSFAVRGGEYFLTVARYVEGNPVRAGLVQSAGKWSWSSHRGRCGAAPDPLIAPLPVSYEGDWTKFVDTPLTATELAKVTKGREQNNRRQTT